MERRCVSCGGLVYYGSGYFTGQKGLYCMASCCPVTAGIQRMLLVKHWMAQSPFKISSSVVLKPKQSQGNKDWARGQDGYRYKGKQIQSWRDLKAMN